MCYLYDDNKWSTVHVIIFYCACIIFPDDDQTFPIDLVFKHGFSLQNVYLTMAHLLIPSRQIIYQMSRTKSTIFTRQLPMVEQQLFILPEHMSSPPVISWVRVTRSLALCVCFVDRCISFCPFSFGNCVVCSSSFYRFWLPI